jgi:hypothetical protein
MWAIGMVTSDLGDWDGLLSFGLNNGYRRPEKTEKMDTESQNTEDVRFWLEKRCRGSRMQPEANEIRLTGGFTLLKKHE